MITAGLLFGMASLGFLLAQDDGVLRVQVNLVRLLVTAKDQAGNVVDNLTPADFQVSDNGVVQKVAFFERQTAQPISVSLLIDNSGSTAHDLHLEADSISHFVHTLFEGGNPNDRAALYSFNYEVVKLTGFTRQPAPLERALHQLHGEGGTSLYDAIYLSANEFFGREGRHVIVIVTDGGDTTSTKDFAAAMEAAQRADAIIFPILIVPIENDAGRNVGGQNALITLAAGTGGKVSVPTVGASLDRAFQQIVNELRTQYMVAYYPQAVPLTNGAFHRIGVETRRAGLQITTRNGYYGESEQSRTSRARVSVAR